MLEARPGRIARAFRFLFGFSERVTRRDYVIYGLALVILKATVDALLMAALFARAPAAGPLPYLLPLSYFFPSPEHVVTEPWPFVVVLWALPFLWIGVSMTVRRAVDAGATPWIAILFFIPYLNFALMLVLGLMPSRPGVRWEPALEVTPRGGGMGVWLLTALFTSGIGLGLALIHTQYLQRYGAALFFGVPFSTGALAGYLANRAAPRSLWSTLLLAFLSQLAIGAGLLIVAVEGVVCLLMALPISLTLAGLGALLGRELARRRPERPALAGCLLVLLPLADMGLPAPRPELGWVTTSVEIAAPPEVVWRHVVAFSELPPPREWLFHVGVAYPLRARISGHGVGAVRRCEFSTGPFIEPITVWDEPRRLAFEVRSSPIPMEEWSPYRKVYAAHLGSGFRSRRGEFRLIALAGGRTRLEGRTWYALDIHPTWYWGLYAEGIVHTIHHRVLSHIQALAEAEAKRVAESESGDRLDPVRLRPLGSAHERFP